MGAARKLDVIEEVAAAAAMLHPVRQQVLGALREPGSAAGLARRIGLPRQKINYHLRELERAGLVEHVEDRKRGNCTERIVRATATHYLVSPAALGEIGAVGIGDVQDRFSWAALVGVAARAIGDLAILRRRADAVGKKLATLTMQTEIRFTSQAALSGFSEELAEEVARLTAKYHDVSAFDGRIFRFFVGAYPAITKSEQEAEDEARMSQDQKGQEQ